MSKEGHISQQSSDAGGGARREALNDPERLAPLPACEALQRLSVPGPTDAGHVLALQRTLGNKAVQRMLVQRDEPDGGGDSARISNVEARTGELETFRDKTIPWVKKATQHINSNRHRIEALENGSPSSSTSATGQASGGYDAHFR